MSKLGPDEIEFEKFSEDVGRVVTVRRQGRLFNVGGVNVSLFPVSVLAEAIQRDVKTIRRWERAKKWPKSMWGVPDGRCKRWYSANQIMAFHQEHKRLSKGDWGFSHSPYFPLADFLKFVQEKFRTVDEEVTRPQRRQHG